MAHPRAGRPSEAPQVKFIAAVLLHWDDEKWEGFLRDIGEGAGAIDCMGAPYPFDLTDYYEDEMGAELRRMIVSFERLGPPTDLVPLKLRAYDMEKQYSRDGKRTINIDPGYIDFHKVVLASFKEGPQKIYLTQGVWADPQLLYQDGEFKPLPWTFPDFKMGLYNTSLSAIREQYKKQMK
jgi:hypothetical protein